jgi:hypothetical protein
MWARLSPVGMARCRQPLLLPSPALPCLLERATPPCPLPPCLLTHILDSAHPLRVPNRGSRHEEEHEADDVRGEPPLEVGSVAPPVLVRVLAPEAGRGGEGQRGTRRGGGMRRAGGRREKRTRTKPTSPFTHGGWSSPNNKTLGGVWVMALRPPLRLIKSVCFGSQVGARPSRANEVRILGVGGVTGDESGMGRMGVGPGRRSRDGSSGKPTEASLGVGRDAGRGMCSRTPALTHAPSARVRWRAASRVACCMPKDARVAHPLSRPPFRPPPVSSPLLLTGCR